MGPKKAAKPSSRWTPLPDSASVMQLTTVPGLDDMSVRPEDMSLQDLELACKFIEQSNKTLDVENSVMERYLQRMDPNLIAKMDSILEAAAAALHKAERAAQLGVAASTLSIPNASRRGTGTEESAPSTPRTTTTTKTFSQTGISSKLGHMTFADKGPRVQASHKIEIINREIDELRNSLEKFREKSRQHNYLMRCRNEELTSRLQEIIEAREYFEQKIVKEGVDRIIGKVPGEKFIQYLETKLVAEDSKIDKLRMKTASIKTQLKRVQQQLTQKEELGEVLHAVDFEQLKIENRDCQERLDEKIFHLVDIKRINGRCGVILNFSKKKLDEQIGQLMQLEQNVVAREKLIKQMLVEEVRVNQEVEVASRDVDKITELIKSYTVPDVLEYINQKAQLHDMKKNVKIWERRLKLKELALSSKAQKLRAARSEMQMASDKKWAFHKSSSIL